VKAIIWERHIFYFFTCRLCSDLYSFLILFKLSLFGFSALALAFQLKIDCYGILGADTDISAIHGPIADTNICKIFKSCFLIDYQKYALPFFQ